MPSAAELATRLRLISGLVLLVFVVMHLSNHALGIHSLGLMRDGRDLFTTVWRSVPGTVLLYGALAAHLVLVIIRVWSLRTFRLPVWQIAQIALGLAIPFLLIGHVVGTRIGAELFEVRDDYVAVLRNLWPEGALRQTVLVLLVWLHGLIGLPVWLRLKPGYHRARPLVVTVGLLLPVLSLLGFALAGRQVELMDRSGYGALAGPVADDEVSEEISARLGSWREAGELAFLGLVVLALSGPAVRQLRARRQRILSVRYPDGSIVAINPGMSVLDASRAAGIPHAAVCGGRGRCSTCRIRVAGDLDELPPPAPDEARVLARIGAGPNIRLACQLRPTRAVAVIPLLSPHAGPRDVNAPVDPAQGVEREIAILFADLRAFTRMAEGRLPYDVVYILNQYFNITGQAIESAGGKVDKFIGDGVMALFGASGDPGAACQAALQAAHSISLALGELNRRLADDLAEPLRIAIGLHTGPVILGSMGFGQATSLTAIGDAVNVASRLESMAKDLDVQLVVSDRVARRAGIDLGTLERRELAIRGRSRPLVVRLVEDARNLAGIADARPAPPPAHGVLGLLRSERSA
ncbi:MAG: adenylate/guanylate cyclase domain-containing protein [Geminicoccaceae bacterium]|nr:adenylate/guanylate cyclase domain-containing protein [Geminicoccaceae bacterium]